MLFLKLIILFCMGPAVGALSSAFTVYNEKSYRKKFPSSSGMGVIDLSSKHGHRFLGATELKQSYERIQRPAAATVSAGAPHPQLVLNQRDHHAIYGAEQSHSKGVRLSGTVRHGELLNISDTSGNSAMAFHSIGKPPEGVDAYYIHRAADSQDWRHSHWRDARVHGYRSWSPWMYPKSRGVFDLGKLSTKQSAQASSWPTHQGDYARGYLTYTAICGVGYPYNFWCKFGLVTAPTIMILAVATCLCSGFYKDVGRPAAAWYNVI